jgi:hypothetical protein
MSEHSDACAGDTATLIVRMDLNLDVHDPEFSLKQAQQKLPAPGFQRCDQLLRQPSLD